MPELPLGTVTFLFTDLEGSTKLLQQLGDSRYGELLTEYRRLLRQACVEQGGQEVDTQGDALFVVFRSARDAIAAAVAGQREITNHTWAEGVSLRVRMGLHTGEPVAGNDGYAGLGVHRAARICAVGHGGQILLSQTTRDIIENNLPEGASMRDLGDHRLKDLQRPERVFQLTYPDLPADFPPLRSLDALPHNLPVQLTHLIGREREIAEVKRLLSTTRLLTLIGSGGCGKTRLAFQVAAEVLEEYPDGVWQVELAALADPAVVPNTVASVLGVREEGSRSLSAALPEFLRPKSLLLVLDNCEHLLSACAQLADALLRSCPNLRLLTTSREGLGIGGELTYRVPSLSLPNMDGLPLIQDLVRCEAVRLFVDRATSSRPEFVVTHKNAPVVAQVCRRLDGIPLAIELAAARVKVLSVGQIAERLDDRFRLLTGGSRTSLPRHQTLRAAMDWSHDLLSERERILFRRLAVFAGGWTLGAAETVCAGERIESHDVLNLLTGLIEKSLVLVETNEGEIRYRLLETIRQYGDERLQESGERLTLRQLHRDWYLELAERAEMELEGRAQSVWLERLESELDNFRAALLWSAESGEVDSGLRLGGALLRFWHVRGHITEGRAWLNRGLSSSSSASVAARAKALNGAGWLAWLHWDLVQAAAQCEASVRLFRELGNISGLVSALTNLGLIVSRLGDYQRATALFGEGLTLSRELGDKGQIAFVLRQMGITLWRKGDYSGATQEFQEALMLHREVGGTLGVAYDLHGLALVARVQGDLVRATALGEESLALFRELRDPGGMAAAQNSLGLVAQGRGDYAQAIALHEESLTLFRKIGDKGGIGLALNCLGLASLRQESYDPASRVCKDSLIMRREVGDKVGIAECLGGLAGLAGAQGQAERAVRLFGAAEVLREAMGIPLPPSDRVYHEQQIVSIRARLGDAAFAKARKTGRAMPLDQTIADALSDWYPLA
jgi:predicted ATPase/class 3 adenylate cyclase